MRRQSSEFEQFEKTPVYIFSSSAEATRQLAREIAGLIREQDKAGRRTVLGLATGSTPVPLYRELIRLHREEGLSFSRVLTFNLDEYYPIANEHRESYHRFMNDQLYAHIDLPPENIHIPDGNIPRENVFEWCRAFEEAITAAGGIDLQVLGIGRTGHIGFNEPGSSRDSVTRLITLDRITRIDAARDFLGVENVPRFAITMGVGTILKARRIVLLAWGQSKAEIVMKAVEGPVTDAISASFLQAHPNADVYLDEAAARELTRIHRPWLVGPVKWTPRLTRCAVSWLSAKLGKPVLKLLDEEYNENGLAELLTEQGPAYDLNIRIFNELQHTITGWPGGKPGADDSSRPERAWPFPKRVLVFSPEPVDAELSMGGTLDRLISQGHEVQLVCLTSGNLGVPDMEVAKFIKILQETAHDQDTGWQEQIQYAEGILKALEDKGPYGEDSPAIRRFKGMIRRGEAREAARVCGLGTPAIHFLDLPFYEKGRYRRFTPTADDTAKIAEILERVQPHQIYATGNLADPSSVQALCFKCLSQALDQVRSASWWKDCRIWLYRGFEKELEPFEIDMAVPLSPAQFALKIQAIRQHQSQSNQLPHRGERNQATAQLYDQLGLAEYEAIESFQGWNRM